MAKINNYRFQQQQKAKQEYHKIKKIKEKAKKTPVSATEELDYIKKLLNGEDVEDFRSKEIKYHEGGSVSENFTNSIKNRLYSISKSTWQSLARDEVHEFAKMNLSDYMDMINGKGYYK